MFNSKISYLFGLILTASALLANAAQRASNFENPVLYEDFPDNDVFVGPDDAFYFSASSFHYSPGAPILKSFDLVNWELISHSVPRLDFGSGYDLAPETRAYRGGIWASTMRYSKSDGLWYWLGCTNFWNNWIYSAPNATGPWTRLAYLGGGNCYYDTGMLIDDDDTMYVVYGNPNVRIAQLAPDRKSEVRSTSVLNATDVGVDAIEGNRLYKINGTYYILNDHPGDTTYVWKSKSGSIWGPYESKVLVRSVKPPIEGGSSPHQGSLVRTQKGDWYYMSFTWAYPAGRLPVLSPITWDADGFPVFIEGSNGGWGASYPLPLPAKQTPSWTGTYEFKDSTLPPSFEWNHDPDTSKFFIDNGLILSTASITNDLYQARNTITHRIHGEFPSATVKLDISQLAEGDRTGLAVFRDRSAYIGIHRRNGTNTIVASFNATIDEYSGATLDNGTIVATTPVPSKTENMWLRTSLDARPNGSNDARFFYSIDGTTWVQLGGTYKLYTGWAFFLGYRFAVFNHATVALGGQVRVEEWTVA